MPFFIPHGKRQSLVQRPVHLAQNRRQPRQYWGAQVGDVGQHRFAIRTKWHLDRLARIFVADGLAELVSQHDLATRRHLLSGQ